MKIVVDRVELLRGIQSVLDIVPTKTALPVLSNILIDSSQPEGIRLNATDLDISITCGVSAKVEKPGSTTIPGKKFGQIIRELPNGKLVLSEKNGKVTVQRLIGEKGMAGNYALMSVPAEEFPELPQDVQGPELKFPNSPESEDNLLCDMISKTVFAVSKDETRPVLNGVLWEMVGGRMTMVATDGHRLAQVIQPVEDMNFGEVTEIILPRKALMEIRKVCELMGEMVDITFDERVAQFSGNRIHFKTRLIEGKFPNCDPIIPKDNDLRATIHRENLIHSLRIVSAISTEKLRPVKLNLEANQLKLESEKTEFGEASDEFTVNYDGKPFEIGFNTRYLLDVLNVMKSEEILMEFKNPMSPSVIREPNNDIFLSVLMPLRTEW